MLWRTPALLFALPSRSPEAFTATLGVTRNEVERLFIKIDGRNTVFRSAPTVRGVPRVLGGDRRLYTIVEVNGYPEVVDVQLVTLVDSASKRLLESQVVYDALACAAFGGPPAQRWCTGRMLNTDRTGIVTASATNIFGAASITLKSLSSSSAKDPPLVAMNIVPA